MAFSLRSQLTLLAAAGLAISVWSGCQSESQPITSKTSKYEVADSGAAVDSGAVDSSAVDSSAGATSGESAAYDPSGLAATGSSGQTSNGDTSTQEVESNSSAAPSTEPGQSPVTESDPTPRKPSATPPKSAVASAPDSDDPKQLLDYMRELARREPRGNTRAEAFASLQQSQQEIIAVADKILSSNPEPAVEFGAAEGKVQAYTTLIQMGQTEVNGELQAFLAILAKSKNPDVVHLARRITFAQQMDSFQAGTYSDTARLMRDFRALFGEEKKDASLFMLGNQVATIFMQAGKNAEAVEAMKLVRDSFQENPEEAIRQQVASLGEQIAIVELDINLKLVKYLEGAPNADTELFSALDKLFASGELGPTSLQIGNQIAQLVETRDFVAAERIYELLRSEFGSHSNAELAKAANDTIESYGKRKALMGKPFVIEGVTLDGSPFDWSQYRGKIVLVDFWATWCQPCLREMPNIRQNYEKYREKGFEVVGVNIDEQPEDVQRWFSLNKISWATVRHPDPSKSGFEHPLLVSSGAEGIPFLVLVGRDGNVIGLNPRGEQLGRKLAELFGEPSDPSAAPVGTKS